MIINFGLSVYFHFKKLPVLQNPTISVRARGGILGEVKVTGSPVQRFTNR